MDNQYILVIGGAGYVGSHFTHYAVSRGLNVTVMDNLSEGHMSAVRGTSFVQCDLRDRHAFQSHLRAHSYAAIFHFAASCLVGESVADPGKYYENNIIAAYNMLEAARATGHDRIIFSSSCAVYGIPETVPIVEDAPKNPISPYGRTKLAMEWMLQDYHTAYGIRSAALRYFNAAGCEPDEGLGEDHRPETHLIPNVVRYALGLEDQLLLFGDDYPTPDGTCIRDYIHVTDLADAHLKALERLEVEPVIQVNLGTGTGYSNKQIVEVARKLVGTALHVTIAARRPGDPPELTADPTRAEKMLGWKPVRSDLERITADVVQWFREHPHGYPD